jgi:hypothetical protein
MFVVQGMATTVCAALIAMPLRTELDSSKDGFCYRHGAPIGAVPSGQHPIRLETAKYQQCSRNTLIFSDLRS